MKRTASLPWLSSFLVLGVLAVIYAWLIVFTRGLSVDEGYLMISVRGFMAGNALYDTIFTQYGPFYYVYEWFLHAVLRIPLTHDATRITTIVHWVLAAGLLGYAGQRLTNSKLAGALVFLQGMVQLATIANEPGHPQEVIAVLLALGLAMAVRNPQAPCFSGLAVLTAILCLIKINVGILFGIATFTAAASYWPKQFQVTVLKWGLVGVLALLPVYLMRRHLGMEWCRNYCVVATGAILITYLIGYQRPIEAQPLGAGALGKITVWFAGVTGVLIGISVMGGTTLHGLIDGLLLTPLLTPTIALLPIPISNLALLNVVVAAACAALYYSRPNATPIALLKGLYGLIGVLLFAGDAKGQLAFMAPWIWLVLIAPGNGSQPSNFPRFFLALASTWQLLQAYPIGGTQTNIGTMLLGCTFAVCLEDSWAVLKTKWVAPLLGRPLTAVAVAIITLLFTFHWANLPALKRNFDSLTPLKLAGADYVRTDANQVAIDQDLTRYLKSECDTFVTYPGVNRLYFWTGMNPPTQFNCTGWGLLSHAQQNQIFAALRKAKNPRILVVEPARKSWDQGAPPPIKPLVDFVLNECQETTRIGTFIVYSLKR